MSIFSDAFDKISEFANSRTGKTVIACAEVGAVAGLTYVAVSQTKKFHTLQGEVQSLQEQMAEVNRQGIVQTTSTGLTQDQLEALANARMDICNVKNDISFLCDQTNTAIENTKKVTGMVDALNERVTALEEARKQISGK